MLASKKAIDSAIYFSCHKPSYTPLILIVFQWLLRGYSQADIFFFFSNTYGSYYLFWFHALSRLSRIMLNNKDESDQFCLGSDFCKIA